MISTVSVDQLLRSWVGKTKHRSTVLPCLALSVSQLIWLMVFRKHIQIIKLPGYLWKVKGRIFKLYHGLRYCVCGIGEARSSLCKWRNYQRRLFEICSRIRIGGKQTLGGRSLDGSKSKFMLKRKQIWHWFNIIHGLFIMWPLASAASPTDVAFCLYIVQLIMTLLL